MLRRGGSGRLRRRNRQVEDVNPMHYMSNLVDAMLVLALGMMLALIISWDLQLTSTGQLNTEKKQQEVNKEDALTSFTEEDIVEEELAEDSKLVEKGTVYYDKETGTYYIIDETGKKTSLE